MLLRLFDCVARAFGLAATDQGETVVAPTGDPSATTSIAAPAKNATVSRTVRFMVNEEFIGGTLVLALSCICFRALCRGTCRGTGQSSRSGCSRTIRSKRGWKLNQPAM